MGNRNFIFVIAGAAFLAAPVHAATPPLNVQRSNAPIDITADKLEVFQEENRAVFTGHVVAIQGETRLTADKMMVFYTKQEEGGVTKKPRDKKDKTEDDMTQGAIRRIEVEQNVLLATPTETASGMSGVYDVEHHEIVLNTNVVLTKEKNTLKGDHLTYNMATGKTVVTSDNAPSAEPGDKSRQRVRALFIPDKKKEPENKTPAPAPAPERKTP